jgi:hypothetical protein
MMPRQLTPVLFTFLAAYLHGGSLTRLHFLLILLIKPLLALFFAVLLLFIVSRSADVCQVLLLRLSFGMAWILASISQRHFLWRIPPDVEIPDPPSLSPLFQRPPPPFSR